MYFIGLSICIGISWISSKCEENTEDEEEEEIELTREEKADEVFKEKRKPSSCKWSMVMSAVSAIVGMFFFFRGVWLSATVFWQLMSQELRSIGVETAQYIEYFNGAQSLLTLQIGTLIAIDALQCVLFTLLNLRKAKDEELEVRRSSALRLNDTVRTGNTLSPANRLEQ